jgi:hypothetical protein
VYQRKKVHASRNKTSIIQVVGKAIKSAALCGLMLSFPKLAHADTTTINGAATGTQGPTVPPLDGGDTLTISPGGSIRVTQNNASGVSATGTGNRINNYGTISTSGSVVTAGSDASGINSTGGSATIINNGTIETYGNGISGGVGSNASGINAQGGSNTIVNTGTINASGSTNARGIRASGGNNRIINSGAVTSTESAAVIAQGGNNAITNSGRITATGYGAKAISVTGDANALTNTGSVISRSGDSIAFGGSGNTLTIGNTSFLAGNIALGTGTEFNITTGANYSKLINYTGTLSGISTSGPVPVFVNTSTKQFATYDPTFFAASRDALADMTNTISSLTPGRFNGTDKNHPLWSRGFSTSSSYSGSAATLSRNYIYSGVVIGYDFRLSKGLMLGALGGYGRTSLTTNGTEMQSYNNSSDDGFFGLYGQKRWNKLELDFALYGGFQDFKQQRYVNDNSAYLGNASTQGSFSGWWISPEAGITVNAGDIQGWSVLPTARLRYAQQWMGAYTESGGGSANATINGRNVAIGQSFIGIGTKKTLKTTIGKNTKMALEGQVGYMYRGVVGEDTVGVTLIGQSLSLPTEAVSRNAIAVSAGVTIDLSDAVALKIRGDAAAGNGVNYVGGGWAGLSVKF